MAEKILIIDDDQHFAQVLQRSLERRGHPCALAFDHAEALQQARSLQPDWATLDLRMEQESGLQLITPLLGLLPNLRIVMLTGYASIPTAVEAIKLGAFNYLHKPATLADLLSAFNDESGTQTGNDVVEEAAVMSVDRLEWEHINRVLNEHQGNVSATARALNMHRRTLQRKLQKYAPR
ncbi:response regulator transcription factor [Parathalassolituus penaei]|uniref:Response regulator n=1 Tax=Parathalassolituus penaei TaxID=2997323 RepID=A0A9X3EAX5_9GAMM|nr:response regulator [Parathalassolituus penaei]MCY0964173.1 response regulator [Parathalassolituus penaei]